MVDREDRPVRRHRVEGDCAGHARATYTHRLPMRRDIAPCATIGREHGAIISYVYLGEVNFNSRAPLKSLHRATPTRLWTRVKFSASRLESCGRIIVTRRFRKIARSDVSHDGRIRAYSTERSLTRPDTYRLSRDSRY